MREGSGMVDMTVVGETIIEYAVWALMTVNLEQRVWCKVLCLYENKIRYLVENMDLHQCIYLYKI